jgi:hypothetical protein
MMSCKGNAVFHVEEDAQNPYVPSKDVLNWMTDEFKATFQQAYSGKEDFDMTSDSFSKFTMKPDGAIEEDDNEASATTTSLADIVNNLRVGGKRSKNWWYSWSGNTVSTAKLTLIFQCDCLLDGWFLSPNNVLSLFFPGHHLQVLFYG